MKRSVIVTLFLCAFTCGLYAQTVDTTVCAVLKDPASFNGKMVRMKGTVVNGFDQFVVTDSDCGLNVNGIWLAYPKGSKAKAGPLALLKLRPAHNFAGKITPEKRTPVVLQRDKEFKHFDSDLADIHQEDQGLCLGCRRYEVEATLVGRLDGVADATLERNAQGKIVGLGGFGNMNAYPARLVLQSVSDVTRKEEDYSKSEDLTRTNGRGPQGGQYVFDPLATARKIAANLQPSPLTTLIQKDVQVFGDSKNPSGVTIGYGTMNEVSADEDARGTKDSPDGVMYECTFNRDWIGAALPIALVHLGQHISDLRNPPAGNEDAPPYVLENNGWVVTTVLAISEGEKYVTLPGGYVMWNSKWSTAERQPDMVSALNNFLTKEELLSK